MKTINIIIILLSSLLFIGYVLVVRTAQAIHPRSNLTVVCTTTILADTVKNIAHDLVDIRTLMGPGVDPHVYQARESDIHALAEADIIFYHGLHLEGKLSHILSCLSDNKTARAVSNAVPKTCLLSADHNGIYDPHIWHNIQLWKYVVKDIEATLTKGDPKHADYYQMNASSYLDLLDHLDTQLKELVDQLDPSKRVLITAHDAFSYFGKEYGFKVIGLQGINTQVEVNLKDISNLVKTIIHYKIPTIFLENSTPVRSIQAVKQCADQSNWTISIGPTLFSDSLDRPGKPSGSYVGMMRHNMQAIVKYLS